MLLAKSASLEEHGASVLINLLLIVNVIADFWSQLTRLEWMWGMQYDSLKLDTVANRIYRVLAIYMCLNRH